MLLKCRKDVTINTIPFVKGQVYCFGVTYGQMTYWLFNQLYEIPALALVENFEQAIK